MNKILPNKQISISKMRPTWDQYFKSMVELASTRSSCERLHVGCILVLENRIIATGYNGFLPNCPHVSYVRDNHEQATVHAEQNAISDCAKRGVSCNNSTAYITHYPCLHCAKILISSGVKIIKYINDYKNDDLVPVFAKQASVEIIKLN